MSISNVKLTKLKKTSYLALFFVFLSLFGNHVLFCHQEVTGPLVEYLDILFKNLVFNFFFLIYLVHMCVDRTYTLERINSECNNMNIPP